MSENKTQPTTVDPLDFLASIEHDTRREDGTELLHLMERLSGYEPRMWGPSIIGFGRYHYVYDSGREGDMPVVGFSPRKSSLVLYLLTGYDDFADELARLGKHRIGKSCLYINKLADVDRDVLEEMIVTTIRTMEADYETFPE